MKTKVLVVIVILNLAFAACAGQSLFPGATPEASKTPPSSIGELPSTAKLDGERIVFTEWGFSIQLPPDKWEYAPSFYNKSSGFEMFVFARRTPFLDSAGTQYSPTIGVMFFSIQPGMQLTDFSAAVRAQMGNGFPSIDSMFGYEGSEPRLNIPALGYYGHLTDESHHAVYIVHSVKGSLGIQVSLESDDSVLDQAKPEFFEIMQSLEFTQ